jgi:hypothetical protein
MASFTSNNTEEKGNESNLEELEKLLRRIQNIGREESGGEEMQQALEASMRDFNSEQHRSSQKSSIIPEQVFLPQPISFEDEDLRRVMELSKLEAESQAVLDSVDADGGIISLAGKSAVAIDALKRARFILQIRFGVKITMTQTQVTIVSQNQDAVIIANLSIKEILDNPTKIIEEMENMRKQTLHIFIDHPHIYKNAQLVETDRRSSLSNNNQNINYDTSIRLNYKALSAIIVKNRPCAEKLVFGQDDPMVINNHSSSHAKPTIPAYTWKVYQQLYYEPILQKTVADTVNTLLHRCQQTIEKYIYTPDTEKRTLILVSGQSEYYPLVENALFSGWKVEIWTWQVTCDPRFEDLRNQLLGTEVEFTIQYLDSYRTLVTYQVQSQPSTTKATRTTKTQPTKSTGFFGSFRFSSSKSSSSSSASTTAAAQQEMDESQAEWAAASIHHFIDLSDYDEERMLSKLHEEKKQEEEEDWFLCPITLVVLEDPVYAPTRRHYERSVIEEWLAKNDNCPVTQLPLKVTDLQAPTAEFLERLETYKKEHNLM